jgi:hypothetical protein
MYYKVKGTIPAQFEVVIEAADEADAAANAHGNIGFDTMTGLDSTQIQIESVTEHTPTDDPS